VNILIVCVAAFAVAGFWYAHNFSAFVNETFHGQGEAAKFEGQPPVASLSSFLWYSWNLVTNQLYLVPFVFFVAGVVVLFRQKGAARKNLYPVLMIAGNYAAFTLLSLKDDRYTEPMLPAVAVVATYWLDSLRRKPRGWASGGIAAYGAVTFIAISFGIGFLPKDVFLHLGRSCSFLVPASCPRPSLVSGTQTITPAGDLLNVRGIRVWSQYGYWDGAPSGEDWFQEEMFKEAARSSPNRTLWFTSPNNDFVWFNYFAMYYFSVRYKITWVANLDQAKFAGVRSAKGQHLVAPTGFAEVKRFSLPDGGALQLYRRGHSSTNPTGPVAATVDDLRLLARRIGHPIYWAGLKEGYTYEVIQRKDGAIFIRYLPPGVQVGDPRGDFLIIVTYPYANALAALQRVANGRGIKVAGGGLALVHEGYPQSVHLAYPGVDFQVEVYDSSPQISRQVALSGRVEPVR
jgi:hypothetical protein